MHVMKWQIFMTRLIIAFLYFRVQIKRWHSYSSIPFQRDVQIEGKDVGFFILGDPAYPFLPWLMKGYPHLPEWHQSRSHSTFTWARQERQWKLPLGGLRPDGESSWSAVISISLLPPSWLQRVVPCTTSARGRKSRSTLDGQRKQLLSRGSSLSLCNTPTMPTLLMMLPPLSDKLYVSPSVGAWSRRDRHLPAPVINRVCTHLRGWVLNNCKNTSYIEVAHIWGSTLVWN